MTFPGMPAKFRSEKGTSNAGADIGSVLTLQHMVRFVVRISVLGCLVIEGLCRCAS